MGKSIFLFLFVNLLLTSYIFSQDEPDKEVFRIKGQDNVVLLQGKITDEKSGNPVSGKITFIDIKGKRTNCISNKTDGAYQIILKPGTEYQVVIENCILTEEQSTISFPNYKDYTELNKNFGVQTISEGSEFFRFPLFNANTSSLQKTSSKYLKQIHNLLQENNKLILSVKISTEDSYFKPSIKKVVSEASKNAKKKKFDKVTITSEQQLKDLADTRLSVLKSELRKIDAALNRIQFKTIVKSGSSKEPVKEKKSSGKSKSTQSSKFTANVFVSVGDMFK